MGMKYEPEQVESLLRLLKSLLPDPSVNGYRSWSIGGPPEVRELWDAILEVEGE
jgi:hypothetical protein